jgi:hypothetical protein
MLRETGMFQPPFRAYRFVDESHWNGDLASRRLVLDIIAYEGQHGTRVLDPDGTEVAAVVNAAGHTTGRMLNTPISSTGCHDMAGTK